MPAGLVYVLWRGGAGGSVATLAARFPHDRSLGSPLQIARVSIDGHAGSLANDRVVELPSRAAATISDSRAERDVFARAFSVRHRPAGERRAGAAPRAPAAAPRGARAPSIAPRALARRASRPASRCEESFVRIPSAPARSARQHVVRVASTGRRRGSRTLRTRPAGAADASSAVASLVDVRAGRCRTRAAVRASARRRAQAGLARRAEASLRTVEQAIRGDARTTRRAGCAGIAGAWVGDSAIDDASPRRRAAARAAPSVRRAAHVLLPRPSDAGEPTG